MADFDVSRWRKMADFIVSMWRIMADFDVAGGGKWRILTQYDAVNILYIDHSLRRRLSSK